MVEMQMENARVERLWLRQLGEDWIRAITEGALDRLEQFCQPDVHSRLLTPKRCIQMDTAADLAAKFRQWFGGCSDFHVEHSRVDLVGERLGICYRFLLLEGESWSTVEQQLYGTLRDGRIAQMQVLCSGFQPVDIHMQAARMEQAGREPVDKAADPSARPAPEGPAAEDPAPVALLEIHTGAGDSGSTCTLLTPAIKAKLREMQSGQVLEVRVNDASARGDIEAWCRLSGNRLTKMRETEGKELRFFVEKK